ncbi:MAG: SDR family oxidoreductase [SAR202 cluster bacterium]|nr:SDR family oxidoreductase [SAR202 cluster bacterium]
MEVQFQGKTAIVTGAAQGIGRAITHGLAEHGAVVWACDIDKPGLERARDAAGAKAKTRIHTSVTDVTSKAAVDRLAAEASKSTGRVDILVHVAGGVIGQTGQPLEKVTESQWQAIFDVNLKGAFLFAQAVTPAMKKAGYGKILFISSGAGLGVSLTGIQAYAAAKAGQIGLVRQFAHELGPFGINVNSVAPGFIRSNPSTERQWEAMGAEGQKRLLDAFAIKRPGKPEDIANAVMFLVSDYSSWITGQTLSVNGGR